MGPSGHENSEGPSETLLAFHSMQFDQGVCRKQSDSRSSLLTLASKIRSIIPRLRYTIRPYSSKLDTLCSFPPYMPRQTPFQKGGKIILSELSSFESISIP